VQGDGVETSQARPSGEAVGACGSPLGGLRPYQERDRPAALEILRRRLRQGDVPYSMHPGEWNSWVDHADPRLPEPVRLIGDDTLVWRSADGHVAAFPSTAQDLARLLVTEPVAPVTGLMISQHDPDSERVLADAGFEPDETDAMFGFVRPLTGALPQVVLPAGYAVRSMTDADASTDARSGADAARLSFSSTMEPDMHRARYRRFMASPAYEPENDLVVIAPDGEVAAFAIVWPDEDLGSGQFEPVGTHPGHLRKGLGRAVVTAGLHRLRELGMRTARVATEESRTAAVTLYLACGFQRVDRLRTWIRRDRQD
jgi:ribosomal protein S18 acetylase RimI-like enzyme